MNDQSHSDKTTEVIDSSNRPLTEKEAELLDVLVEQPDAIDVVLERLNEMQRRGIRFHSSDSDTPEGRPERRASTVPSSDSHSMIRSRQRFGR